MADVGGPAREGVAAARHRRSRPVAILGWPVLSLPSTQYRPDVDGLRAIAVMLVLNFHAFPEATPGGFVGVDVFFVISGFLITGILLRARDLTEHGASPAQALRSFYARRFLRIFPLYYFALAVVLFLNVTVLGCFALLVFQKISLPFF